MTRLRRLAGAVLGVWAAWWAFFAFAQRPPLGIASGVALVLFAIPLLAWRWRGPGGVVLVAEALTLLAWVIWYLHNPPLSTLFLGLTLVLPPLLAGVLLIVDGPKPNGSDVSSLPGTSSPCA